MNNEFSNSEYFADIMNFLFIPQTKKILSYKLCLEYFNVNKQKLSIKRCAMNSIPIINDLLIKQNLFILIAHM